MTEFELQAWIEHLDAELSIDDVFARRENLPELHDPDFYRDCARFVISKDEEVVFDEYPLFPLMLVRRMIQNWRRFVEDSLTLSIGEEQLAWLFRTHDLSVEFFTAFLPVFDHYQTDETAWDYIEIADSFEEVKATGRLDLILAMDSWSWINGLLKIGQQHSKLASLGVTLLTGTKAEYQETIDLTLDEMNLLISSFEDQRPKIEDWLKANAQAKHWFEKGPVPPPPPPISQAPQT